MASNCVILKVSPVACASLAVVCLATAPRVAAQAGDSAAVRQPAEAAAQSAATLTVDSLVTWDKVKALCDSLDPRKGFALGPFCSSPLDSLAVRLRGRVPSVGELTSAASGKVTVEGSAPAPALPGINESTILWGITGFVVERFKQDVAVVALRSIVGDLCTTTTETFMPNVCRILRDAKDSGKLPMLSALRSAARADFPLLLTGKITGAPGATLGGGSLKDEAVAAALLVHAAMDVARNRPVLPTLGSLASQARTLLERLPEGPTPLTSDLLRLTVLAATFTQGPGILDARGRVDSVKLGWLAKAAMVNLRSLGEGRPSPGRLMPERANEQRAAVASMAATATELRTAIERLAAAESRVAAATGQTVTAEARLALVEREEAVFALMRPALGPAARPGSRFARLADLVKEIGERIAQEDYAGGVFALVGASDSLKTWLGIDLPEDLRRALTVVAELAQAQDAQAVSNVLAQVTAPPGSYLRKRGLAPGRHPLYWSVNAYLGPAFGWERPSDITEWGKSLGPFLPLGVEVGWRASRGVSLGVFAYVLDLGALATYRLGSEVTAGDTVSTAPQVGFRQVLAPGAAVVLGLFEIPLTVGYTYGRAPQLREVTKGGVTSSRSVTRSMFFVAYDLPLF